MGKPVTVLSSNYVKWAKHPDRAVIIVTHDARIFEFGDRIVHMEDGRVGKIHHGRDTV